MDQSKVNKNFKATVKSNFKKLYENMKKNRKDLLHLNSAFKVGLEQQQQSINHLKNSIRTDNIQRDQNISEISHNLALLKSFVTEKLSNHPNDYMVFRESRQGLPIQGGRRKTRKRKRKRKNKGKKRKTKKR